MPATVLITMQNNILPGTAIADISADYFALWGPMIYSCFLIQGTIIICVWIKMRVNDTRQRRKERRLK